MPVIITADPDPSRLALYQRALGDSGQRAHRPLADHRASGELQRGRNLADRADPAGTAAANLGRLPHPDHAVHCDLRSPDDGGRPTEIRLDAVRLAPTLRLKPGSRIARAAKDVSGIEGYAYRLTGAPQADLTGVPVSAASRHDVSDMAPGLYWFHALARDFAGNGGPALRQPLV